jgi:signal transduction histidine kinase
MKLHLSLLLLFCLLSNVLQAQQQEDKQLRDSIFNIYHSMSADTTKRVEFMRNMLQKNIGKKWSVELLDSALVLATDSQYREEEVGIRYDYYRHYKYQADTLQMGKAFRTLESVSRKYKMYDLYFAAWGDILQFNTVRGDTEYVLLEARRMKEEAQKLDNRTGIYYSMLTTARALRASKHEDEAIEKYRETLELPHLPKVDMATVYNEIHTIYQLKGEYLLAISELNMQRSMMEQALAEAPEKADSYRDKMLDMELSYSGIYLDNSDLDNLQKHLKLAEKYYSSNSLFSYRIKYHIMWGGYYCLRGEWDKSFREYDTALSLFDDTQPLFKMTVRIIKGHALKYAGRYKEAAENYLRGVQEMDSLNRDVLRLHEEAHQANYTIRQALLERATADKRYNQLRVALIILVIIALSVSLWRALHVRRMLRKSEQETREALNTVEAADKMKEVFLRNITSQIRVPLNLVVGFSEVLSTEKDLSQEQMEEYAGLVKKNAGQLSQLIFDVLDLSRLESGMMKFNVVECDAVQMCRDAKMMVEMQENNAMHLQFDTTSDSLLIRADSGRFMRLLSSVLSAPEGYQGMAWVNYTLSREGEVMKLVVTGSPLLKMEEEEGEYSPQIQHDINRLYLETFKGSYLVKKEERTIVITYPI